jgi:uncharacterized protein (DUF2141 family)
MKRMTWSFLLFATALTAQPPCAIRGIVVDALTNQPLPRTRVFAEIDSDSDNNSSPPVRQITDASGNFCFEKLAAGEYAVRASRAYYIDAQYGEHWHGAPGHLLEISPDDPGPAITIKIAPQAIISGMLVDADGDPLQGAQIELLKGRWKKRKLISASIQKMTTDDSGRYRFAGLTAGTYFLRAIPASLRDGPFFLPQFLDQVRQSLRQTESKTYYRDALSFREATPIQVSAGQEVDSLTLTFHVTEARHVSGQVAPEALNTSPRIVYLSEEDSSGPEDRLSVPIQSDGHFLTDDLSPDRYLIRGPAVVSKIIDLTEGDIDDLVLESNQPIEFGITVHLQGARSLRSLALLDRTPGIDEDLRSIKAQLITEDRFKVAVHPGQYEIVPGGDGSLYFIKSLVVGGEPQQRNILDLQGGAQKSIDLFLSPNPASVAGRVISNQPIKEEVTLLLENESDPESYSTKTSGPDGFQWTLLQAGKYRLYAFEEWTRDIWETPGLAALLAAKSAVLDVKEGQHQHINVPLISIEDLQSTLKRTNF